MIMVSQEKEKVRIRLTCKFVLLIAFCYAVTSNSVSIPGLEDPLGDDDVGNDPVSDGVDDTFDDAVDDAVQENATGNIFYPHLTSFIHGIFISVVESTVLEIATLLFHRYGCYRFHR